MRVLGQQGPFDENCEFSDEVARLSVRIVTSADKAAPNYDSILNKVLEIQASYALTEGAHEEQQRRGFLATTWTLAGARALLDEGGWLVVATDTDTDQMQAYSMVSLIRHLPGGQFIPATNCPMRSREQLIDETSFMYGYQLARHPHPKLGRIPVSREVFLARFEEAARRRINIISCVMDAPIQNRRSLEFLTAMAPRCRRIGVIDAPIGPPLKPGPTKWVCFMSSPIQAMATAVRTQNE